VPEDPRGRGFEDFEDTAAGEVKSRHSIVALAGIAVAQLLAEQLRDAVVVALAVPNALWPTSSGQVAAHRRGHGENRRVGDRDFVKMIGSGLRPRRQRDWTGGMFSR